MMVTFVVKTHCDGEEIQVSHESAMMSGLIRYTIRDAELERLSAIGFLMPVFDVRITRKVFEFCDYCVANPAFLQTIFIAEHDRIPDAFSADFMSSLIAEKLYDALIGAAEYLDIPPLKYFLIFHNIPGYERTLCSAITYKPAILQQ